VENRHRGHAGHPRPANQGTGKGKAAKQGGVGRKKPSAKMRKRLRSKKMKAKRRAWRELHLQRRAIAIQKKIKSRRIPRRGEVQLQAVAG